MKTARAECRFIAGRLVARLRGIGTSLRARLVLLFLAASLLPLTIVGTVSYLGSIDALQELATRASLLIAEQLRGNVQALLTGGESYLKIGTHETAVAFLDPHNQSERSAYELAMELVSLFKFFRTIYASAQGIEDIYLLGLNGNCFSERYGRFLLPADLVGIPAARQALARPGSVVRHYHDQVAYAPRGSYGDVISIVTAVVKPVTRDVLGVIVIDVSARAVREMSERLTLGRSGRFSIITTERTYLHPRGRTFHDDAVAPTTVHMIAYSDAGSLIDVIDGQKTLVVFTTLEGSGWKILGEIGLSDLLASAFRIRRWTMAAGLTGVALTVVLFLFVSDVLTKPLLNLKDKMKEAQSGNLQVRASCRNRDEVADLCAGFNVMIEEINSLIERSLRERDTARRLETKALQAQINPHFLYNTLEVILWTSQSDDREQVIKITKALSGFFRIALSRGREQITIREELELTENYLLIQKMRHLDRLGYELEVDPSVLGCTVPKLVLQPVVENAIEHGIVHKRGRGTVTVCVRDEGDVVLFRVRDTGRGMSAERLSQLRAELEDRDETAGEASGFGLGLRNVHQRIRLCFGAQWGVAVESLPGEGTEVTIRIPISQHGGAGV